MKKILLTCLFSLCLLPVFAAGKGDTAFVVPTTDYSVEDRWYKTKSAAVPEIPVAVRAVRGQNVYLMIVLQSYGRDKDSRTSVVYDIKVTRPAGGEFMVQRNLPALSRAVEGNPAVLAEKNMFIRFGKDDAPGKYLISARVRDQISDAEQSLTASVELVEAVKAEPFPDDTSFVGWMMSYYLNPHPERLPAGLSYYLSSELSRTGNLFPAVLGFSVALIRDNRYLLPAIIAGYPECGQRERAFYLNILQYFEGESAVSEFVKTLPKDELEYYEKLKKTARIFIDENLFDARQLDALCGAFFATGRYQYAFALMNALNAKSTNPTLAGAANWSLDRLCRQHELAKSYCAYAVGYEKLSPSFKKDVSEMLAGLSEEKK